MKMMIAGFSGWARMNNGRSEEARVVDTAITVVGTALLAVTYMLLRA